MDGAGEAFVFQEPEWADEAGSTSVELKARLASASPPPSGAVFAARRQTAGKGRVGNVWQSAATGDLTFSFVWKGGAEFADAGTLSFACGLAVWDFLASLGIKAECKWPNDVFVGDGKICGILLEGGRADFGGKPGMALVAGIGVNLRRNPDRDRALGRPTASVEQCLGRVSAPEALLPPLLRCLERRITDWRRGGFAALRADMERALRGRGEPVRARTPGGIVEGVVAGLGESGELLVQTGPQSFSAVSSLAALEDVYSGNALPDTV